MEEVIHNLRYGVATPFKHNPEPLWAPTSHTQTDRTAAAGFTDNLCSWLKQGFVAGPFKEPPIEGLRINTVFSVEQPDKYRNIVNMSFSDSSVNYNSIHTLTWNNLRIWIHFMFEIHIYIDKCRRLCQHHNYIFLVQTWHTLHIPPCQPSSLFLSALAVCKIEVCYSDFHRHFLSVSIKKLLLFC